MCGIGGIYRFGTAPIEADHIKMLLCALEHRGRDATGVALAYENGHIEVLKDDQGALQFIKGADFLDFINDKLTNEVKIVLLHDRAATKGAPKEMKNNHPLFTGLTAVTHNGHVRNDDELFKELELERSGEVDSDILRAILDRHGLTKEAVPVLSKMGGSVAAAAVSERYPQKLLLLKAQGPIEIGMNDDFMFWASEKQALYRGARFPKVRRGLWMTPARLNLDLCTMDSESAWLFGPNGLEWHTEFKLSFVPFKGQATSIAPYARPDYYGGSHYGTCDVNIPAKKERKRLKKEAKKRRREALSKSLTTVMLPCRNPQCKSMVDATGYLTSEYSQVICKSCGWLLRQPYGSYGVA